MHLIELFYAIILILVINCHDCHDCDAFTIVNLWIVLGLRGDAGVHSVQMEAAKWTHLRWS